MKMHYWILATGLVASSLLPLPVRADSAFSKPSWVVEESWILGSETMITSVINKAGNQLLTVDGVASFALNGGHYVRQAVVEEKARVATFLIYRAIPRGGYYSNIITMALGVENVGVEFRSVMGEAVLGPASTKPFIAKIGETRSFPLVMLLVGRQEKEVLPSKVLYEWQLWDLHGQELIKRFEGDDKKPFIAEPKVNPTGQP